MTPDLHLKLSYPIFSPSKLTGEFATLLHGLLITGLGSIGGLANHLQDRVPRLLKRIASFGLAVQLMRKGNDCVCYGRITTVSCADTLSGVWLFASAEWLVRGIRLPSIGPIASA
jgi:hypothetical protein